MAAVDLLLLDGFTSAGWRADLRPFEERSPLIGDAVGSGRPSAGRAGVLSGVNVVAVQEGRSRDALVVVAHHDTVPGTGGADDNGSGVAALLELAHLLRPLRLRLSVVLAAVDHEELGFFGARQLVRQLVSERRVAGVVVYEMLAYTSQEPGSQRVPPGIGAIYRGQVRRVRARDFCGDFTAVIYNQSARTLATYFAEGLGHFIGPAATILLRAPLDLPVIGALLGRFVPFAADFARSDHVPFWEAGLPALQITDTANFRNPHYHASGDTPDTLDYDRLADITAATALAIERFAKSEDLRGPAALRRSRGR